MVPAGQTELQLSSAGPVIPAGDYGKWVTYYEREGQIKNWRQAVRSTSTTAFDAIRWQVSLQPFSSADDPLADEPEGLLAYGEHVCAGVCTFVIEFEKFMPGPQGPSGVVVQAGPAGWGSEAAGSFLPILNLLPATGGGNQGVPAQGVVQATLPKEVAAAIPANQALFSPPMQVYFRTVPVKAGVAVGPVSNTAIWNWAGTYDAPDAGKVKIPNCKETPGAAGCIQPPKFTPPSYEVEFLSYHGWINPKNSHYGCYVQTEKGTDVWGKEYPAGTLWCPPKAEEPGLLEAVVNFIVDAVNWVSNAYSALKEQVVNFVAQFVPAGLCDKACIGMLVNAGLAAIGLPPEIPNFNQLANQGIDYLAEQAVASIGVPKEIQELAGPAKELAEAEFKAQVKTQFKKGIEAGLKEMEKHLSKDVSFIPDGIPVKPDPEGDYEPPATVIQVTRKAGTKECQPGNLIVSGVAFNLTPEGQKEAAGTFGYLYAGMTVDVPPLAPGEKVQVPVVLKPFLHLGFPGAKYYSYGDAVSGWSKLYLGGSVRLQAIGGACLGGDVLEVAADAQLIGQQVAP